MQKFRAHGENDMAKPRKASASARRDLVAPALRTFFRITAKWGLTTSQIRCLLGSPSPSTLSRWKKTASGRLSQDVMERISYVFGIYKALHIHFSDSEQADGWVKRANAAPQFGGGSALDRMMGGQVADLYVVRQYLDSQLC
jgi:hypothetical protein